MLISKSTLTIKKSKFIGYLYKIENEEQIQTILKEIQKENKKARHICLAYRLKSQEKFKNDQEVGSPAKILLKLLQNNNLNTHLIIVVRYFGGIKLGQGGVQRAFKLAALELFKYK